MEKGVFVHVVRIYVSLPLCQVRSPPQTWGQPFEQWPPSGLGSEGGGGSGRSVDQWGGCTSWHNSVACPSWNLSQKNPHFHYIFVMRDIIYMCLYFTVGNIKRWILNRKSSADLEKEIGRHQLMVSLFFFDSNGS